MIPSPFFSLYVSCFFFRATLAWRGTQTKRSRLRTWAKMSVLTFRPVLQAWEVMRHGVSDTYHRESGYMTGRFGTASETLGLAESGDCGQQSLWLAFSERHICACPNIPSPEMPI
ncbi:hypothetical protein EDC01DRAFT_386624 [Geopyxis carbonaria]|nr:hypothetical protein EDC01DRAFT_386624 [Geopyxis carbonaria]